MPKSNTQKKSSATFEARRLRRNQIIFGVLSVIVILSWVIALVAK